MNNEFGFGLDLENFVTLHLKVNQELSDEEIKLIKDKGDKQKSFDKVLRFAMIRPRSLKEVKDYLKRKCINESIHQYIIKRLTKLELLDDLKFAKWWVEQRQSFSPKSKRVLNNELRIKGINREIIQETLSETKIDEVKIAKDLIESKSYKWEKLDDRTKDKKLPNTSPEKALTGMLLKK